jgi:predicted transcriptional regulator
MEAHAIRDGVILARYRKVIMETASLVLSKLLNIMESDSLVLSKLLNNGNFKRSEIAYILYDVVELS